jgi:SPP1 family predicted phage head-tail adaptor
VIPVRAGDLRRRITIEQATDVVSLRGGVSSSWATYVASWARIELLTGRGATVREVEAARSRFGELTHKITMRYRAGITDKMRVNFTRTGDPTRYFDIRGVVDPDENRHVLELWVWEHQA